jgi:hypothetical protein
MIVYAGIDESGYGPLLGPLVIARSVFTVQDVEPSSPPPCLWERLAGAVSRHVPRQTGRSTAVSSEVDRSDPGGAAGTAATARVAIDDSKLLYTPAAGLRRLEEGVLALLPASSGPPGRLAELLEWLALDRQSAASALPWYVDEAGGPILPVRAGAEQLAELRRAFHRHGGESGVAVAEVAAAVVFENRFNAMVRETGSKGLCAWRFVADHLSALWERYGRLDPYVAVDRQGGRKAYGPLLAGLFSRTLIEVLQESPAVSRYRLSREGRSMLVEVRVDSERRHLPVAYASMTAKYLRELLMMRFQAYWTGIAPEVRPTAGYFGDGRRFLEELEPHLARLGCPRDRLARCC